MARKFAPKVSRSVQRVPPVRSLEARGSHCEVAISRRWKVFVTRECVVLMFCVLATRCGDRCRCNIFTCRRLFSH